MEVTKKKMTIMSPHATPRGMWSKSTCRECSNLRTQQCPLWVWGRVERNKYLLLDVDPDEDFCSKFELKK